MLDPEGMGGGALRFEEVVVPERLFRLWDAADPILARVFDRIRRRTLAGRDPLPPRELYLSRRAGYWRSTRRVVANEVQVEDRFRRRGFTVIDPAGIGLRRPGRALRRRPTLAGLSGSALHNCLFQRRAAGLIELEHPAVYREGDGAGGRTPRTSATPSPASTAASCPSPAGRRHGGAVLHLDLAAVEAALPPATRPRAPLRRRAAAAAETRALDLLPPARAPPDCRPGASPATPPPCSWASPGSDRLAPRAGFWQALPAAASRGGRCPEPETETTPPSAPAIPAAGRPLATLFITSYNQEAYVGAAIDGAFAQTYAPLEIVMSDDASADRTFEIMREKAAAYRGPHRIVLNRNEKNLGIVPHVEKVMSLASGEIIVENAGDDVSVPHRVETHGRRPGWPPAAAPR